MAWEHAPIYDLGTFDEVALGPDGNPLSISPGIATESEHGYVHLFSFEDKAVEPGLKDLIANALVRSVESTLSAQEATFVRLWLSGGDDQVLATQLNLTPEAVRATRDNLQRRLRVSFDPPSS